jgi:hypothetical protein
MECGWNDGGGRDEGIGRLRRDCAQGAFGGNNVEQSNKEGVSTMIIVKYFLILTKTVKEVY